MSTANKALIKVKSKEKVDNAIHTFVRRLLKQVRQQLVIELDKQSIQRGRLDIAQLQTQMSLAKKKDQPKIERRIKRIQAAIALAEEQQQGKAVKMKERHVPMLKATLVWGDMMLDAKFTKILNDAILQYAIGLEDYARTWLDSGVSTSSVLTPLLMTDAAGKQLRHRLERLTEPQQIVARLFASFVNDPVAEKRMYRIWASLTAGLLETLVEWQEPDRWQDLVFVHTFSQEFLDFWLEEEEVDKSESKEQDDDDDDDEEEEEDKNESDQEDTATHDQDKDEEEEEEEEEDDNNGDSD